MRAGKFAGSVSYVVNGTPKVVLYWAMRAFGEPGEIDAGEIAEARWVTLAVAKKLLSFRDEYNLLRKSWSTPRSTS